MSRQGSRTRKPDTHRRNFSKCFPTARLPEHGLRDSEDHDPRRCRGVCAAGSGWPPKKGSPRYTVLENAPSMPLRFSVNWGGGGSGRRSIAGGWLSLEPLQQSSHQIKIAHHSDGLLGVATVPISTIGFSGGSTTTSAMHPANTLSTNRRPPALFARALGSRRTPGCGV
jgi:hypothetical protein